MRFRAAKKVVRRWARGLGGYTDNRFGSVVRAHRKLESYYGRRGTDGKLPGLPNLAGNGVRSAKKKAAGR